MEYKDIEKLATEQFQSTGGLIPVPVVDIAKKLGLPVYEIEMPLIEGVIPSGVLNKLKDGNWGIILNNKDAHTRKRFSIAHEIGHFLTHKDRAFVDAFTAGETFYRDGTGDEQLEKEANFFAANLLMPAEKIKEVWALSSNPSEMARKFDVSEVSMTFRLKNLGLIDVDTEKNEI